MNEMAVSYHNLSENEVLKQLNSYEHGLSSVQAEQRLHQYGFNEIKEEARGHPLKLLLSQFYSPLIGLLLIAVVISLFVGEKVDAIVIGIIIVLNAVLGFTQEYRAEKAIAALQKLAFPKAIVLRDGQQQQLDSKYVVPGDIILLETGDWIPADSRLLEVHSLHTQEGPLTGESQPVAKTTRILASKIPLADRKNMVYSSTIISNGRGRAVITATGMQTEIGKIATLIQEKEQKTTPLQKKLHELGKYVTIAIIIIAAIIFVAGIFTGQQAALMFLTAIALAVAAIPEGLPAVITISLAVGVQRMVKRNALVRKLPSVETLGSVTIICTDKTGTLTHNQMTVTQLWANQTKYEVSGLGYEASGEFSVRGKIVTPHSLQHVLTIGALCNNAQLQGTGDQAKVIGDPTEAALLISAAKAGMQREKLEQEHIRVEEIPFSSERKMMTTVHKQDNKKISYTKGAPDVILERCNRILINGRVQRLDHLQKKVIQQQNEAFANDALRVLGFAYKDKFSSLKETEQKMIFAGLQAMIDPPREEVKQSLKICKDAGIRVIMITGDQLATAKAIAAELGISGKAVSGIELEGLELEQEIKDINIFARVNPEHKLQIVKALKKQGEIVAMTGDGVNDAPALKKADIGISMGISGTEVAKEASDIILLDDNFSSIVNAIEEGRGVYDNIKKFFAFLFSSNIGEVGVIAIAILVGLPLPLTPLLILFINLVTDGLPAIALGFDPFEPGAMLRKPRKMNEPFYAGLAPFLVYCPLLMITVALSLFAYMHFQGEELARAQTTVFLTLVMFELYQAFASRSIRYPSLKVGIFKNKYLIGAVMLSFAATLAVIYVPALQRIFETRALSIAEFLLILAVSSIGFIYLEAHKWIRLWKENRKVMRNSPPPSHSIL